MKFGVCVRLDIEKIKYLKKIGYDYAEGNCFNIANESIDHIEAVKALGFPIPVANCFMPGEYKIITQDDNRAEIRAYLARLFERAAYLGIEIIVFGSSGARRIPDGMSVSEGRSIIADFIKKEVLPLAEKYDITIAIEPLRTSECNAINTVADGIEVAKAVGSDRVRVISDLAHNYVQNENIAEFASLGEWIVHAHISNPDPDPSLGVKRLFPSVDDKYDILPFIETMKATGVERISVEADVIDFEKDASRAIEVLKRFK